MSGRMYGWNSQLLNMSNGNLGIGTQLPTYCFELCQQNIGATQVDTMGMILRNDTKSVTGTVQLSPAFILEGQAFGSTLGTSQRTTLRQTATPGQAATPSVTWTLAGSINGGSYANIISASSIGGVTISQLTATTGTFSAAVTTVTTLTLTRTAIASTSSDGIISTNTTAATNGSRVQMSPRIRSTGTQWDGAASVTVDWIQELVPVTGAVSPVTNDYVFSNQLAAGGYNGRVWFHNLGGVGIGQTPTAWLHIKAGTATASTAPLKLTTGTSLTAAEAGAFEYTTPQLFFTNGGAQRQEIPQIQQTRVTSQYDKTTSTTLGDITGLTATLVAGKIYKFEATLFIDADATGGSKYAIGGTATATSIKYQIQLFENTPSTITISSRQTALGGSSGQAGTTAGFVKITGLIVCNTAGTLTVQFAQNASNGTSSVLTASTFTTQEIA